MRAYLAWAVLACLTPLLAAAQERPGFYTTHDEPRGETLPWLKDSPTPPPQATPFGSQAAPPPLPQGYQPSVPLPGDIPFQRAQPYGAQPVAGPLPMERAVPTENIDAIETSEPAPPAPIDPGADPVKEDPAAPTELTAPLFAANTDTKTPREIVIRVLNKVTGRAEELVSRPGSVVGSGKLEIETVQCYISAPSSLPDSVALLIIREKLPDELQPKLLFSGWMYASSPSLTALEHPVYDVTMADCRMKTAPADAVGTDKEKPKEAAKKPAKKAE